MVWGCMGWNGVGKLLEVVGKMDARQYVEILESGVVESFEALNIGKNEQYFQQDNNPQLFLQHCMYASHRWPLHTPL